MARASRTVSDVVEILQQPFRKPPPPEAPNVPRILVDIWLAGAAYGRSFRVDELARLGKISVADFLREVSDRWDDVEEALEARRGA